MNESPPVPVVGQAQDFAVVGIGASAGGLVALQALFETLPAEANLVYVVVVHLSPEHESHIAQLLQRSTAMPVRPVDAPTPIEPNCVYVISPRSHLLIHDGELRPAPATRRGGRPMTIDVFFETLADTYRHRAIGIILSGSGSDGTLGVRALKAQGAVTFAQLPAEAEYDAMPRNAIASGVIDFVLPVAEIPAKLAAIWSNARSIRMPELEGKPTIGEARGAEEQPLQDILATVRRRTGHDFSQYKRSTLLRRIERRLQVNQLHDLVAYSRFIAQHDSESGALLSDLLISVTSFFRDAATFDYLADAIIPRLFTGLDRQRIRIWVPGCATGEEVYSLAMLLAEQAEKSASPPAIGIFATDIDADALSIARAGVYAESISEQLPPERLQRWFVRERGMLRVQKALRDMVTFAVHNVIQDPPFSHIDVISCRNVLIYLTRQAQLKVLDRLHFALCPAGYLVLGSSESIDEQQAGFIVVDKALRIFSRAPRAYAGSALTSSPARSAPARTDGNAVPSGARRPIPFGELHQRLLERYAPPSLVVDEHGDIVHVSDTAGAFLRFGAGEPSTNLVKSVPDDLRYHVRSALEEAFQTMATVERPGLTFRRDERVWRLSIQVHPVRDRESTRTYALVLFDAHEGDAAPPEDLREADSTPSAIALENELADMRTQLRAAAAKYEDRNDALRTSNEELQATNEELHATTEELETGKEELQSINEELVTLNQELTKTIHESRRINDDLQNFMTATGIAALFVDRELRLMRYTPFARDVFNVIPTDIGRPLSDITHRMEGIDFAPLIREVLASLHVIEREVRSSDGNMHLVRVLPYRTTDDRIAGAVITFTDVTEHKAAEAATRRSEAWARVVVESVRDYAILTLDPEGIVQTWNRGAQHIFGYAASEIVGKSFELIFTAEDREAGVPDAELRVAREVGRADDERWQLRKDGTRFFASGVCATLQDADRYGYVKILRDLTEHQLAGQRRDALLALERTNRETAEITSRMKDDFLATLSHEMRNPLALIQMQAELVLRAPEALKVPRIASAAEIIHQTVRAQAQFVDDLLDVSRIRTGKLTIERQLMPLPLVVADSIGGLRDEADRNKITLNVEIDSEPMFVEADAVRVKQIAWNLLSNAIKFTPQHGQVLVRLRREGNEARLDVEDNGQGIAPEVLPHIFEWFLQAESGSTRRKGGMGIGLALVKQLVELHGGRVTGHSKGLGHGACFSVWLPLQLQDTRTPPPLLAAPPDIPATKGRLSGLRILIIDDLVDNAAAMADLLQYEGADTALEITAHAAILRAANESFDVIISDLAMPEMDGFAMLGHLRSSSLNANTPAIAYSGYGGSDEVARSKEAGFQLHLVKPVDVERLFGAIESLAGERANAKVA